MSLPQRALGPRQVLSDRFLSARKQLGMTQEEVARKANIHVSFYGRVERNKQNPSYVHLSAIAKVLGIRQITFSV